MRTAERLIVIGGDAAGMSAASRAKRQRADLEVVAFERGSYTSYSACGMPYYVGGVVEDVEQLVARGPEAFHERGIDARVRHEVEEIGDRPDPAQGTGQTARGRRGAFGSL